jgi:hypothetical protein
MNTHRRTFVILKTELPETTQKQPETLERLSSLDVFTSSHNATFISSQYLLHKSTINRAQAGLNTCTFNFNSKTSKQCTNWTEVTMTQFAPFNLKTANASKLLFQF